jgi:hypothetical protein
MFDGQYVKETKEKGQQQQQQHKRSNRRFSNLWGIAGARRSLLPMSVGRQTLGTRT